MTRSDDFESVASPRGPVSKSSGLGTPRTRFATEYVFTTLSSALRAGISEREQQTARGGFTAPGRDECSRPKPVFGHGRVFAVLSNGFSDKLPRRNPKDSNTQENVPSKRVKSRRFKARGRNVPTATASAPLESRWCSDAAGERRRNAVRSTRWFAARSSYARKCSKAYASALPSSSAKAAALTGKSMKRR